MTRHCAVRRRSRKGPGPSDNRRRYGSRAFVAACSSHQSLLANSFPQNCAKFTQEQHGRAAKAADVTSAGTRRGGLAPHLRAEFLCFSPPPAGLWWEFRSQSARPDPRTSANPSLSVRLHTSPGAGGRVVEGEGRQPCHPARSLQPSTPEKDNIRQRNLTSDTQMQARPPDLNPPAAGEFYRRLSLGLRDGRAERWARAREKSQEGVVKGRRVGGWGGEQWNAEAFSHQRPGLDRDRKFLPCPRGLELRVPKGFTEGRRVEHARVSKPHPGWLWA